MAMGAPTPSGPFKPSCPSSLWFSSSPPCRVVGRTLVTSSSPRLFLLPRRDHQVFQSTNAHSSCILYSRSSNKFQRISSFSIRRYSMEDGMPLLEKRGQFYQYEHHWRQQVSASSSEPHYAHAVPVQRSIISSSVDPKGLYKANATQSESSILSATNHYMTFPEVWKHAWVLERKRMQEFKAESKNIVPHGTKNCSVEHSLLESNTAESKIEKFEGLHDQNNYAYFTGPSSTPASTNGKNYSKQTLQSEAQPATNGATFSTKGVNARTMPHHLMDRSHSLDVDSVNNFSNGSLHDSPKHGEYVNADKATTKAIRPQAKLVDQLPNLSSIYDKVILIDTLPLAKTIVQLLTTKYKNHVHACDTEVAKIDVKQETPVDHGEIICFSIYSGSNVDFGNGKSCIWVDVLDGGGKDMLMEFAPFFEDPSIKKVWHNYSFDSHVIENYGIRLSGFHADTMHMARLWDSSRRTIGGYSLEALTSDPKVMNYDGQAPIDMDLIGKTSMKTIFGKKKLRKDGQEGKIITIPPVEELQREEQNLWICYSAVDSMTTLQLFESLKSKLKNRDWYFNGELKGSMYEFYEQYWRPFGELLVRLETEGMLVDRSYLAEIQKVATLEQQIAANRFRNWAARYCPDAMHMNVGSDIQLRQLFFGGIQNRKDQNEYLPLTRTFKVPNTEEIIEEGKKAPSKFRNIVISGLGVEMETEEYTASGWPSVSGVALKALAGKVSSEYDWIDDTPGFASDIDKPIFSDVDVSTDQNEKQDVDISSYGTAYKAFVESKGDKEAREACHAIAALCDMCSIDSLISNFILPLQSYRILGRNGRIHCSLNINTETGRLSARRPNLQNQPALEKDRYKIRQAFIAAPGNSLIVADYGQLELRILAHLTNCKSMKDAFKAGGDFHSRTALNMYSHIREAVENREVLLEWHPQPGEDKPPVPLLKDAFASERRKAKMLNFSIAYGKTPNGLARDWKVSVNEARETVNLWYSDRKEVLKWQRERKREAIHDGCVKTLLGRTRTFPSLKGASNAHKGHIERAAINTPVQGSAADVAMCAMLEISNNPRLNELGWRLLLQVHDEVILEGPSESAEEAKAIVVECMSKPFNGRNILDVELAVDAKCAQNWYSAK